MRRITFKLAACAAFAAFAAACQTTENSGADGKMAAAAPPSSEVAALLAMLRRQLTLCWRPPAEIVNQPVVVTVRFELKRDGTLIRAPVIVNRGAGDAQDARFQLATKSALAAVRTCVPLKLPAARYELWEDVEITFDPRIISH
jgi:hypothetical protein